jgi:uncharacterized protein (DUF4415 family)
MSDDISGTTSKIKPKTDWRRLRSMTEAEIHAAIIDDPDAKPTDETFWKDARVVTPRRKETVTMRLDADLLEWFRRERAYKTRINAILRDYMNAHVSDMNAIVGDRSAAALTSTPEPSSVYQLFEQAIIGGKQIQCTYKGRRRELCPVILGHSQWREKALTYQFGGQSNKGLPPGGQWRCLWLSEVRNVRLRDGPWYTGDRHDQPQDCVEVVDLDVNPDSPYNPKRSL